MTTTLNNPITASSILFRSQDAAQSLNEFLRSHELVEAITVGMAHLTNDTRDALHREISTAAADLVNLDLAEILVTAWRKHAALADAARRTTAAPGSSEIVELATHHITATRHPYIDVFDDNVRIARIHLQLQLDFTVDALVAVVRGGRLTAVQSGRCTASATLLIEGHQVATRTAPLALPVVIRLGTGLPLLPDGQPDLS